MKDDPTASPPDANPYASPTTESIAEPEEKYPWFTAARAVFVKNGAELPAIDLCGAPPETPLEKTTRSLDQSNPQATAAIIAIFGFIFYHMDRWMDHLSLLIVLIFVGSYLLRLLFRFTFPGFWMKRLEFTLHIPRRIRVLEKRLTILSLGISLFALIPAIFVSVEFRLFATLCSLMLFRLIRMGTRNFMRGKYPLELHFSERHPGWLRLTGVHPEALGRLREIEADRDLKS